MDGRSGTLLVVAPFFGGWIAVVGTTPKLKWSTMRAAVRPTELLATPNLSHDLYAISTLSYPGLYQNEQTLTRDDCSPKVH